MQARNLKSPGDLWPLGVEEGTEKVNKRQKKIRSAKVAPGKMAMTSSYSKNKMILDRFSFVESDKWIIVI